MTPWQTTHARWQTEKTQALADLAATPDETAYDQQRARLEALVRTLDKRLALTPPAKEKP